MVYKLLNHEHNADGFNIDFHTNMPAKKIEQMVKSYKNHRCDLDFDLGFLNLVV